MVSCGVQLWPSGRNVSGTVASSGRSVAFELLDWNLPPETYDRNHVELK